VGLENLPPEMRADPSPTKRDRMTAIKTYRNETIAWVILDRPARRNALRGSDLAHLATTVRELSADPTVRAICVGGAGGHFASGADIDELQLLQSSAAARAHALLGQSACDALEQAPVPVVAAIEGCCVGGGLEIAMSCDFRLAGPQSTFGQVELRIGSVAAWGGIRRLPRLVGVPQAKRLVYTGQHIDADRAASIGLIDEVVAEGDVQDAAGRLATQLSQGPREALAASKRALDHAVDVPLYAGLQQDRETFAALVGGSEFQTGVAKFLARSTRHREALGSLAVEESSEQ